MMWSHIHRLENFNADELSNRKTFGPWTCLWWWKQHSRFLNHYTLTGIYHKGELNRKKCNCFQQQKIFAANIVFNPSFGINCIAKWIYWFSCQYENLGMKLIIAISVWYTDSGQPIQMSHANAAHDFTLQKLFHFANVTWVQQGRSVLLNKARPK